MIISGEEKMIKVTHLNKDFKRKIYKTGIKGSVTSLLFPKYEMLKAVEDLNFHIHEGESVGYIGPNGSGKSTTIKLLSGILSPTSGEIKVNGLDPSKNRIENNRNIGAVFGNKSQLWWDIPIIESFEMIKKLYSISETIYRNNLDEFSEIFKLNKILYMPERQLSLGQKMKCNIAAAFLHNPKVVYLDEPTIGLDVESKQAIREAIRRINQIKKVTFIVTSHDYQDIEAVCGRVIVINSGKIILDSDMSEVRAKFGDYKTLEIHLDKQKNYDIREVNLPNTKIVQRGIGYYEIVYSQNEWNYLDIINRISEHAYINDISISGIKMEDLILNKKFIAEYVRYKTFVNM